jgi:hypothetical protein
VECAPANALAIEVRPEDAGTAAPLAATATGTVQFGGYLDSFVQGPSSYAGPDTLAAGRRAGTYSVHIDVPGYAPFDTTGVGVRLIGSPCASLETQRFTARFVASP